MRRKASGVLLALTLLAGCSSGSGGGSSRAQQDGVVTTVPVADRKEPVELAGTTLTGARLDLSSLRGKPVVLNVWGSWCGPCRTEAPALQQAADELGTRVSFVGIAIRDTKEGALAHERNYKITYPSLLDKGDLLLSLRGAVAAASPPVTLVLDAQGRIAARFLGVVTSRTLIGMVDDVAGETGPEAPA